MPQKEIANMECEHENGNTGPRPYRSYMKLGIWDQGKYSISEYGKRENKKLGRWNQVILSFELGNLQYPLESPFNYSQTAPDQCTRQTKTEVQSVCMLGAPVAQHVFGYM